MCNRKRIFIGLCSAIIVGHLGVVQATPTNRTGLEQRSQEAFEDLDATLNPSVQAQTNQQPEASSNQESSARPVETVTITEVSDDNAQTEDPIVSEPSQKELYERLLREEAQGLGYTTEKDDGWLETAPSMTPPPQPTTTVIIQNDDERHFRRSGLWYFFRHLMNGRAPHRDYYRSHEREQAGKARRRAQAKRRAEAQRRADAQRRAEARRRIESQRRARIARAKKHRKRVKRMNRRAERRAKKRASERRRSRQNR